MFDQFDKNKNEKCPNEFFNKEDNSEGFYDLEIELICNDPNHNIPQFIYIPPGKGYKHKCPRCKKITNVISPNISF
jgi:hypothetical protein